MKDSIPEPLRPLIGNRVYGCDDCQLVCPWNKYARITQEADFHVRNGLDDVSLVELFGWDQATFEAKLAAKEARHRAKEAHRVDLTEAKKRAKLEGRNADRKAKHEIKRAERQDALAAKAAKREAKIAMLSAKDAVS